MFVLAIGLCEVQEGLHDGSVLDDEFPYIARPSSASFLTSNEYDGFSTATVPCLKRLWLPDSGS